MTTKKSEPVREAKPPKAAEIKKRTELVLDGRFAQIKTVAQVSADWLACR